MIREQFSCKEEFQREELLEIFEEIVFLMRKKKAVNSIKRFHISWKRFLNEVMCILIAQLEESRLVKFSDERKLELNPHHWTRLYTIGSIDRHRHRHRHSHSHSHSPLKLKYGGIKSVPYIRISGIWLEKYGFTIGGKMVVYPENNQLLLKVSSNLNGLPYPPAEVSNG